MKKKFIGMDLGNDELHIAVVDPDNGKVEKALHLDWNIEMGGLDEERATLLKKINDFDDYDDLILSFPANKIFSRYLELPILAGEQLQTALNTRIRKFYPYKDSIHTMANVEVPPLSGDKKRRGHMVFLVRKRAVDNQVSLLKSLNLSVTHIDLPQNALTRWLAWENKDLEKGNHLFILLQKEMALIGAFKDKALYFTSVLQPPLFDLEEWRKKKIKDLNTIEPFVENLVAEILSILYFIKFKLAPVEVVPDDIILIGKCHSDQLLKKILDEKLKTEYNIPVIIKDTKKLQFDPSVPPEEHCLYSIAAGLSLRVMEESIWAQ